MGAYVGARLLATAALWVRIETSLKIKNGRYKQRSGQHTLARQKNIHKKKLFFSFSITDPDRHIQQYLKLFQLKNKSNIFVLLPTYIILSSKYKAGAPSP
jgi:hypothetical protein